MASSSIRDVAARAGVSVGTVSNVLNHPAKVSGPAAERVHAAIRELGFVRNGAARQLRAGRSTTVGLIVLDVRNPFFTDLARGAEERAAQSGLSVLLGNGDESRERESTYLDLFEEQGVLGVLISPFGDVTERLERLRSRRMAAVLVDRSGDESTFSSVSVDDIVGGRLAADHLLAQGRRRIAFVGGPFEIRQVADRHRGAQLSVDAQPDASLEVIAVPALTVLAGREAGRAIAMRDPASRPDAIFAANDLLALGVLHALVMQGASGIGVPTEIAIIGYDDIDFAGSAVVPLSSIRQPSGLIGQTALEILVEEADDPTLAPRQVVFQPELVVRESTAG